MLSQLKAGGCITLPSGEILDPAMVVGPAPPARRVVILGDTNGGEVRAWRETTHIRLTDL